MKKQFMNEAIIENAAWKTHQLDRESADYDSAIDSTTKIFKWKPSTYALLSQHF